MKGGEGVLGALCVVACRSIHCDVHETHLRQDGLQIVGLGFVDCWI